MAKYRIQKTVRLDDLLGRKEDGLYVKYSIQKKVLWWWEDLKNMHFEKYNIFNTAKAAEDALRKHLAIEDELATDGIIVKTLAFPETANEE